jgi:competence ComEA-like helix-hairpin-helix protein
MRGIWISMALLAGAVAVRPQEATPERSKEVFSKVCGTCHAPEMALSTRRSQEQWQELVDLMVSKGLKAGDEDLTTALNYLVRQYGRVNVNRARAEEIAEVLGLSAKEAEAIVKQRKDSGRFEDFDELAKTPGLDPQKLEKSREAVAF